MDNGKENGNYYFLYRVFSDCMGLLAVKDL